MADGMVRNWRELSGQNNWEGLIAPSNNFIDNNLRKCIIHYGERIEAIYDAYDDDTTSNRHGFPRYPPENLFSNVGLAKGKPDMYKVTNYVYAMLDVNSGIEWVRNYDRTTWIGYVAVATDEGKNVLGRRDILICWRGTVLTEEWLKNVEKGLTSGSNIVGRLQEPEFHKGFHSIFTASNATYPYSRSSARDQVRKAVREQMEKYKSEGNAISITVTGHSLGGALATLNAADIVYNNENRLRQPESESDTHCMVTAFVFASPKVGNQGFNIAFNNLSNLHLLRIRTEDDIIPGLPLRNNYVHVGKDLEIKFDQSVYLNIPFWRKSAVSHNLEIYLHGVAGPQAKGKLLINRDHSLVNKWLDVLKSDHQVPPQWWDPVPNKGMVQQDDGTWKVDRYKPVAPRTDNV